jgi:DNA-binding beta-propeller fold protein YncE
MNQLATRELTLFSLGAVAVVLMLTTLARAAQPAEEKSTAGVATVDGMPAVLDPGNVYSEAGPGRFNPAVSGALERVYVPEIRANRVDVIDPATFSVADQFRAGPKPQHVIPSWDLKTLWVAGSGRRHSSGSLTPIDPISGKPGATIRVPDAYNLYFSPDGKSAIVVAEGFRRLEFRDPQTMALKSVLPVPQCRGINHADFSIDGRYAIFTCEFEGSLVKIDTQVPKVLGVLNLSTRGMPQDIRLSPDGKVFYVADMMADGVFLIDGDAFSEIGFVATGIGAHGLYPSRDGTELYVSNRGSHQVHGPSRGPGSVSVIDFSTRSVKVTWFIPGGGSPDMGNVNADGKVLWLSGRFDNVVYAIDTSTGEVKTIKVGREPHGLTIWPQPGRYSLGHTGNMR